MRANKSYTNVNTVSKSQTTPQIHDIWFISTGGICLHHHETIFSTYEMDEQLFAGFIGAITSFTSHLSQSDINSITISDCQLFFLRLEDLIIVTLTDIGLEERFILPILEALGKMFLRRYGKIDRGLLRNRKLELDEEINQLWKIKETYETLKRQEVEDLINQFIEGRLLPNELYWRVMRLYFHTSLDASKAVIKLLQKKIREISLLISEPGVREQLTTQIKRILFELKHQYHLSDERDLFIVCNQLSVFQTMLQDALDNRAICHHLFPTIHDAEIAVINTRPSQRNQILFLDKTITLAELIELEHLAILCKHKIFLWLQVIPENLKKMIQNNENFMFLKQQLNIAQIEEFLVEDVEISGTQLFEQVPLELFNP